MRKINQQELNEWIDLYHQLWVYLKSVKSHKTLQRLETVNELFYSEVAKKATGKSIDEVVAETDDDSGEEDEDD